MPPNRIEREARTVAVMIDLYCRRQHHARRCPECAALLDYARRRLDKCPFQEGKTVCSRCLVHCYQPAMRQKIRAVMRYAGPRMLYTHPLMAVQHLVDKRRSRPVRRAASAK